MQNGIIPVAKHFPGHGATDKDSHLTMPVVNLDFETLEDVHIRPFLEAVKNNIPAIMVAHVHYPCFEEKKIPASMSKKIINDYLIVKHNYKGLVLSDDMVMGGISEFERIEALVAGLEAGIDMFIYRNADDEIMDTIELLAKEVSSSKFLQQKVDYTFDKIYTTKKLYL